MHCAAARGDARLGDHVRAAQERQQTPGESEVTEVVGAELQLEAVLGRPALRRGHHARVVDQHVDRAPLRQQRRGESLHRGQRGEIELEDCALSSDAAGRGSALGLVADGHQHLGAGPGQVPGELETRCRRWRR